MTNFYLRLKGDYACFTRPEFSAERISYKYPIHSAIRGVLESIYWKPEMYYIVKKLYIEKQGEYFSCRRNEVKNIITSESGIDINRNRTQRNTLMLRDVEYVVEIEIHSYDNIFENVRKHEEIFKRRAKKGQYHTKPYFGMREFVCEFDLLEKYDPPTKNLINEECGYFVYDTFTFWEKYMEDPKFRESSERRRTIPVNVSYMNYVVKDSVVDFENSKKLQFKTFEKIV